MATNGRNVKSGRKSRTPDPIGTTDGHEREKDFLDEMGAPHINQLNHGSTQIRIVRCSPLPQSFKPPAGNARVAHGVNRLHLALQEIGRIERTLFTMDWLESPELRRRCQAGLNKGEARHFLAHAIFVHRQGRITDRTFENQRGCVKT